MPCIGTRGVCIGAYEPTCRLSLEPRAFGVGGASRKYEINNKSKKLNRKYTSENGDTKLSTLGTTGGGTFYFPICIVPQMYVLPKLSH